MIKLWHRRTDGGNTSWEPGPTQQRDNEVLGLAMSADGKYFVATERHRSFGLWSIPDLRLIRLIDTKLAVWKPALSPDGRWISIGLWHRAIQMWSGPTSESDASGVHLATTLIGHTQLISAESFNADTTLLATTAPDGMVKIWDVAALARPDHDKPDDSRRCLATLLAHADEGYVTAFLPPPLQHHLAVGYRDGSVRVWDLRHYDQHIEGQRDYQLRLRAAAGMVQ
jgi:WD40 repeat protein